MEIENNVPEVTTLTVGSVQSSPTQGKLAKALAAAQGKFKPCNKTAINPFFKSKYADLSAVVDSCKAALSASEIAIMQHMSHEGDKIVISTRLMHSSGEWIQSSVAGKPAKNDFHGLGAASTYLRRFALSSMLCIAADEDDDGNSQRKVDKNELSLVKQFLKDDKDLQKLLKWQDIAKLEDLPACKVEDVVQALQNRKS